MNNIERVMEEAVNNLPVYMKNEVSERTVRSITSAIMVAISQQLESKRVVLKVKRSEEAKEFPLIYAKKDGDVGYDLPAVIPDKKSILIKPGERGTIPTGIFLEIPKGYWASIEARSSTSKLMIEVPKGVIDEGYRGELFAVLLNVGNKALLVNHGDRYVQLIMHKRENENIRIEEVDELSPSERGDTGFGSTGRNEQIEKHCECPKKSAFWCATCSPASKIPEIIDDPNNLELD